MNPPSASPSVRRRDFLRDASRYSALAGMGALIASALARHAPLTGAACPGSGECSRCALTAGCTLPRTSGANPKPNLKKGNA